MTTCQHFKRLCCWPCSYPRFCVQSSGLLMAHRDVEGGKRLLQSWPYLAFSCACKQCSREHARCMPVLLVSTARAHAHVAARSVVLARPRQCWSAGDLLTSSDNMPATTVQHIYRLLLLLVSGLACRPSQPVRCSFAIEDPEVLPCFAD